MKKAKAAEQIRPQEAALPKLLVVDDDEAILKQIQWALADEYSIFTATDRDAASRTFRKEDLSVVLLDLGLPPSPRDATEGLQALEDFIAWNPLVKVIVVSGNSERANALRAIEKGAFDIFPKPVDLDELKTVLHRVYRRLALEEESVEERQLADHVSFDRIVGSSPAMKSVLATLRRVAETDVPVLISGESGTGKELIANAIHALSARNAGPFAAINCAAIPENLLESELFGYERGSFTGATTQRRGKLESAQRGTLFLDEIGELAAPLQVKMLRFLQDKVIERVGGRESIPVDCRVIAATNQDLEKAVKENRFREDLFFRLAVIKIPLPPLRERGSDVAELADHLIESFSKELRIPPKKLSRTALQAMLNHAWPGTGRELQNRIKRALVLADGPFIGPEELELEAPAPELATSTSTLKSVREDIEREVIARSLAANHGNISRTAKELGISRPTLYELIAKYRLSAR